MRPVRADRVTDHPGGVRSVRLENLPVASLLALRRHLDDLLHEFKVIASGMATGVLDVEVPRRLADLIEEINEQYSSQRLFSRRVVDDAAQRGDETVTLELSLPVEAAGAVARYDELLDEADDYCRRGQLLTLAPPPELVDLRRRILQDLLDQLH